VRRAEKGEFGVGEVEDGVETTDFGETRGVCRDWRRREETRGEMRDENAVEGETRDGGVEIGEEMGMLFGEVTNRGGAKSRGCFNEGEGMMMGEGDAERRATKAEDESGEWGEREKRCRKA